jgi:medium-chain acyl-[acyl-carrier-protein] hydrolase
MSLTKLVCLPYAGGNHYAFTPWQRALAGRLDVIAPELPGRAARMAQPALARLDDVVAWLRREYRDALGGDYALWGHSMGALIAYELARALEADGAPPRHLFVSGALPPHLARHAERYHDLGDAALIGKLARLAGTPDEVLANAELMAMLLPSLRADFAVCETYAWRDAPLPSVPVTAIGGEADVDVPLSQLHAWRRATRGDVRVLAMPGNHFFLREQVDALATLFATTLNARAQSAA